MLPFLHSDTSSSPPHRTVHDVLRHTAFQCPSSGRIQHTPDANSTQTDDAEFAKPRRRIPCFPSAPHLPVLFAGKEREAFVDVPVDHLENVRRVALAEIYGPSLQDRVQPGNQDRNRRPRVSRRQNLLDSAANRLYCFLRRPGLQVPTTRPPP